MRDDLYIEVYKLFQYLLKVTIRAMPRHNDDDNDNNNNRF